jgi:DNA-binding transcriptional LysR family regulator
MLDLRRLRLLSELSRRGTIAEVARVVGYTPSAVSQSLAQLEREAGTALLERDGRGVRLTPAAHGLVARTERALAELDAAEAELAAEHDVRGEIVIGAFPSAAARLVVPAVAKLSEQHPELACSVREHEPEDGIPLLRSGALDVLVSERYEEVEPAPAGGLEATPVLSEPLLLVLPRADTRPAPVALRAVADAPWIAGLAGTQFAAALEQACRSAGFQPLVAHRADDALLFRALVAAGAGIGLLPALACTDATDVRFVEVAEPVPPHRHIDALTRRAAARRPALAATLAALREAASARRVTRTHADRNRA